MTATTEISLVGGASVRVAEPPEEVEKSILAAARGSIMELAWFADADTGEPVGINPEHVVLLRRTA